MATKRFKQEFKRILALNDIKINGDRPWDIQIKNDNVYEEITRGTLGLGESYMAGEWEVEKLDEFVTKLLQANLTELISKNYILISQGLFSKIFNFSNKRRAFQIGQKHYDIGNDLFQSMLDRRMVYSCAYWSATPKPNNLNEAQEAKLDLICQKIGLKAGMKVLDIGGGWGSFAKFASEKYQAKVTNISVSREQVNLANKLTKGLNVKNILLDYRDLKITKEFDAVVSIGMFEHVGYKNYKLFMRKVSQVLKDDGLFLLHTIGGRYSLTTADPWISKYIFPNSMLPSIKQIGDSIEKLFVMEDWHNFGADYDKTLMQWWKNFDSAWPKLKNNYSEKFYRMWKLYLLSCAAGFRTRNTQLWQIVLSKNGIKNGYRTIR